MQPDPTKIGFNYQGNQYPPINQPLFGAGNNYPSYQAPPPPYPSYGAYSQPPVVNTGYVAPSVQYYGQTVLYPQPNVVIVPAYRPFWMNQILTTITPNLRIFLLISGIFYLLWSFSVIGLEVYLIVESYSTYYRGIWAGGFLLAGGISMLTVACRTSYSMVYLIRLFILVLFFCIFALVLSAINYSISTKCSKIYSSFSSKYTCDKELIIIFKIVMLVVFIVATIQTMINIFLISHEHKKTMAKSNTSATPHH